MVEWVKVCEHHIIIEFRKQKFSTIGENAFDKREREKLLLYETTYQTQIQTTHNIIHNHTLPVIQTQLPNYQPPTYHD